MNARHLILTIVAAAFLANGFGLGVAYAVAYAANQPRFRHMPDQPRKPVYVWRKAGEQDRGYLQRVIRVAAKLGRPVNFKVNADGLEYICDTDDTLEDLVDRLHGHREKVEPWEIQ